MEAALLNHGSTMGHLIDYKSGGSGSGSQYKKSCALCTEIRNQRHRIRSGEGASLRSVVMCPTKALYHPLCFSQNFALRRHCSISSWNSVLWLHSKILPTMDSIVSNAKNGSHLWYYSQHTASEWLSKIWKKWTKGQVKSFTSFDQQKLY